MCLKLINYLSVFFLNEKHAFSKIFFTPLKNENLENQQKITKN